MLIIINYNINRTNINIMYSWYFIKKHLIDSLKNISKYNVLSQTLKVNTSKYNQRK